jgi:hypothetical protein
MRDVLVNGTGSVFNLNQSEVLVTLIATPTKAVPGTWAVHGDPAAASQSGGGNQPR